MTERPAVNGRPRAPQLTRSPRPSSCDTPLALSQQRLWILDQILGDSVAYNNVFALRLRGPMDTGAMTAALAMISRRHEALRTSFPLVAGEPRQRVAPPGPLQVRFEDLTGDPGGDCLQRARAILAEEQLRPYDLAHGPLARYLLVRLDAADHLLAVCMHHIICDGGSFDVIARELGRFYAALAAGRDAEAEPLALQYADYALWQQAMAESGRWDSQLRFWREQLSGAPSVLSLPTDRPRSEDHDDRSAAYTFSIDPGMVARALRLCHDVGVTPFMAFFTIFALLLYRYQPKQRRDVVIGVPFAGRFDRRLGDLIGMFINTLAVRVTCDDNSTFRKLLLQVRETLLNAYGNADIPFDWVVRELKPSRDTRHNPLFQVLFQLQHANDEAIRLGDLEGTGFSPSEQPAKFDITLSLGLVHDTLICEITYKAEIFDEPTIVQMAADYQKLVASVTATPDHPVAMFLPASVRDSSTADETERTNPC
jgi:hypothetical protein